MKLLINISEKDVKRIGRIKFLLGGKEDRELQLNVINAIKQGVQIDNESLSSLNDLRVEVCDKVIENHTVEFLENFSQDEEYQNHCFFFKNLLLQTEKCLYAERAKDRR